MGRDNETDVKLSRFSTSRTLRRSAPVCSKLSVELDPIRWTV